MKSPEYDHNSQNTNVVYGKLAAIKITNVLYSNRYCCICLENSDGLLPLDTCEAVDGGENNLMILTLREMIEAIFDNTVLRILRDSSGHMCPACTDSVKKTLTFLQKTKTTTRIFDKYFSTLSRLTINLLQLRNTENISTIVFNLNLDNVSKDVQEQQREAFKRRKEDGTEVCKKAKITNEKEICEEVIHIEVNMETEAHENIKESREPMGCSPSDRSNKPGPQFSPHLETKVHAAEKATCCPICEKRPCKHENYLVAFEKRQRNKIIECPECKELLCTLSDIIDHINKDHFKSKPTIRDVCNKIFQGDSFKKNKIMEDESQESQEPEKSYQFLVEFVSEEPPIGAEMVIDEATEENMEMEVTGQTKVTEENEVNSLTYSEKREIAQSDVNNKLIFNNLFKKDVIICQQPKKPVKSCLLKKDKNIVTKPQKSVRFAQCPTESANKKAPISVDTDLHEGIKVNIENNAIDDAKVIEEDEKRSLKCEEKNDKAITKCKKGTDLLNFKSSITPHASRTHTVHKPIQRQVRVVLIDVLKNGKEVYQKSHVSAKSVVRKSNFPSNLLEKDKITSQKPQESEKFAQYPISSPNKVSTSTETEVQKGTNIEMKKTLEIGIFETNGKRLKTCEETREKSFFERPKDKDLLHSQTELVVSSGSNKVLQSNLVKKDKVVFQTSQEPMKHDVSTKGVIVHKRKELLEVSDASTDTEEIRDVCNKIFQGDLFKKNKVMEDESQESQEPEKSSQFPVEFVSEEPPIGAEMVIDEATEENMEMEVTGETKVTEENEVNSLTYSEKREMAQSDVNNKLIFNNLFKKDVIICQQPKKTVKSCLLKKDKIIVTKPQNSVRFAQCPTESANKKAPISVDTDLHEGIKVNIENNAIDDAKVIEEDEKRSLKCEEKNDKAITKCKKGTDLLNFKSSITPHASRTHTVHKPIQRQVRVVLIDVLKNGKEVYQKSHVSAKSVVRKSNFPSNLLEKDKITSQKPQESEKFAQYPISSPNKVSTSTETEVQKGTNIETKKTLEIGIFETNGKRLKTCEETREKSFFERPKDKDLLHSQTELVVSSGSNKVLQSNLVKKDKVVFQTSQEPMKHDVSTKGVIVHKRKELLEVSDASTDTEEIKSTMETMEELQIIEKNEKYLLTYEKQRRNRTFECPKCKKLLYSLKHLIAHVNKNNCTNKPLLIAISDRDFQTDSFRKPVKYPVLPIKAASKIPIETKTTIEIDETDDLVIIEGNKKTHKAGTTSTNYKEIPKSSSRSKTNRHKEKRVRKYHCSQCDRRPCKHEKYMLAYGKLRGNGIIKCPECKDMLYSLSDLIAHVNKKHPDNKNIIRDIYNKEILKKDDKCQKPKEPANCSQKKKPVQKILKVNAVSTEDEDSVASIEIEALEDIEVMEMIEETDENRKSEEIHLLKKDMPYKSREPMQCLKCPLICINDEACMKHRQEHELSEKVQVSTEIEVTEEAEVSMGKEVSEKVKIIEANGRNHECGTCSVIFKNRLRLSLHLKSTGHILKGTTCCPRCVKRPCKHEKYLLEYEKQKVRGKIECFECKDVLSSLSDLIAHVNKDHFNRKGIKCDVCNEVIRSNLFKNHKSKCQKPQTPVKCAKCPTLFVNEEAYLVHRLEHELLELSEAGTENETGTTIKMTDLEKTDVIEEEKSYECGTCGKTFKHKSWLRLHMKATEHVAKRKLSCPQCTKRPCQHEDYLLAFENQNVNSIECQECNDSLDSLSDFIAHINRDHLANDPIKCNSCSEEFYIKSELITHLKIHEPKLTCEYCGCEIRRSLFRKHKMKCHKTKKNVHCAKCPALFANEEAFEIHKQEHQELLGTQDTNLVSESPVNENAKEIKRFSHEKADRKKYDCPICQFHCSRRDKLSTHLNGMHKDESRRTCPACVKIFDSRQKYLDHRKTTEHKFYKCSICDEKFLDKRHLNKHRNGHDTEEKKVCNICGKLVVRGAMATHMRIHTGDRPYPCHACSQKFKRSSERALHVLRVHV